MGAQIAFQSAPLREGRPMTAVIEVPVSASFNPRPCARGDGVDAHA